MHFADKPAPAEFRAERRTWPADHLVGDFRDHLGVGGLTDDSPGDAERTLGRPK